MSDYFGNDFEEIRFYAHADRLNEHAVWSYGFMYRTTPVTDWPVRPRLALQWLFDALNFDEVEPTITHTFKPACKEDLL